MGNKSIPDLKVSPEATNNEQEGCFYEVGLP
jgi:hypothetical protein